MNSVEASRRRVLVYAPIGRDGPASAELLRRAGLDAFVCGDLPSLVSELQAGAAAVFVAEEGLFGKDLSGLSDWIEAQPAWSDLPFVVLTSRHEQPRVAAWRKTLVETLRNVSLLERPVQPITLTSTVQAALRARARQYEVQALLAAREKAAQDLEALVAARTEQLRTANAELVTQMAERARIEENLRQAQKMEAIGQLTGGVAHDFNNLLMVIQGGLDMIDRQEDPARRARLLQGMRQAADRGSALTRQLLAFSRRQPLAPEAVDLQTRIGGMRELLDRSLRGDVHVDLEFDDHLWPVEVDAGELELVILNLAFNARDAMPKGGEIVISARNVEDWREGDIIGDFVRLEVRDTGTGMSDTVKARVFEPFFTTKEIGKGSGLGLAQAYGFARQSGGSVHIESKLEEGTRVILMLPRSAKPASAAPRPALDTGPVRTASRFSGCVLLVEDDDEVAALVTEMLHQIGFDVTRAASAAGGLGALANGRRIDVVFSDIMMPGAMNGVDLAREIHHRRPDLPVLLTSGFAEASRRAAEDLGVHVLPKPYRLDDLASAIRETMANA
ncbi:ATP-binding protein [Caulobacter sp. NIBR1757]|uniref:ATP-binding protein n=1 Tax=Caulobacter sp. NIBR1757 TaxID=3016000 RepID=UPI0022F12747|nr:ATP-binding protein [Caulobacter sp. NIBR1757]WGM40555.1 Sensor histidine kinase RcsC [Caulobacter sp. NIBR1757]